MATIDNDIAQLTVKDFLSKGKYVIPIYQRNYDWGEKEALQLLEDISDYAKNNNSQNYYIGSAVIFVRNVNGDTYYETIDGQQRLTTLTILAALLKHLGSASWFEKPNLSYDHRREADEALAMLQRKQYSEHQAARNIADVYALFEKNLPKVLGSKGLTESDFADYLFSKVIVLRITVPQDTQLNHYFEIMNTRGEQLEKHEVLKAILISNLDPTEHTLFHLIWEACSDMSSYVQMNFSAGLRKLIFGAQWANPQCKDFDSLCDKLNSEDNSTSIEDNEDRTKHTLNELFDDAQHNIRYELPRDGSQDEGKQDRFRSIVNFPNFLLQVLKVCYHHSEFHQNDIDSKITLDDKILIPIFQSVLKSLSDEQQRRRFVKYFIMELLFLRTRYDSYVIKREYISGAERWSLKSIRKYDNNKANYVNTFSCADSDDENQLGKEIRMLQAMFHVSAPTQIYKHWLNALLYCIHKPETIDPSFLRDRLYNLARSFMLDVYIGKEKYDFEDIVYGHDKFMPKNSTEDIDWSQLDCGCSVHNFVFNFYDFITWRMNPAKYPKFEFTYRTSVEHFYPQHPMPGYDDLRSHDLHSFGNLCLISRGMNSKFSNNMPKAKLDNYGLAEEVRNGLSLKLLEMMDIVKETGEWGPKQISDFEKLAKERIIEALRQTS